MTPTSPPPTDIPRDEYPRMLVVNHEPFNNQTATGLTMRSLLHGWPRDRIAEVYLENAAVDESIAAEHWWLDYTLLWPQPAHRAYHWMRRRSPERYHITQARAAANPKRHVLAALRQQASLRVKLDVVNLTNLLPFRVPDDLLQRIDSFQPEILYTLLGSTQITRLVHMLTRRLRIPVISHFMDDWPGTLHRDSLARFVLRPATTLALRRVLARSPGRMVISDAMATEFNRRYGGPWESFMIAVDASRYPDTPPPPRAVPRFVFVGGLHLNRWRCLREIGEAAGALANAGVPVDIVVYAHPALLQIYREQLTLPPTLRVGGSLTVSEVPAVLLDADVLIHVESFDQKSRLYTKYSVSSKLPEYMVTGRPILAYGPGEVASLRYVESSGCGLVVGRRDATDLGAALRRLATDPELRRRLGHRGRQIAQQHHDADTERKRFHDTLRRVAKGNPAAGWGHA